MTAVGTRLENHEEQDSRMSSALPPDSPSPLNSMPNPEDRADIGHQPEALKRERALNQHLRKRISELERQLSKLTREHQSLRSRHESLLQSKLGRISAVVSRGLDAGRHARTLLAPGSLFRLLRCAFASTLRQRRIRRSQQTPDPTVDIVIPVYKGLEATRICLESVLASVQVTKVEVIVINDQSPEPELVDFLRRREQAGQITLLHQPENKGFVASVNRGMRQHPRRDVILLNSDTRVCHDWVDRLRRNAYTIPRMGTVTPFSNNATICSYPQPCCENPLPPEADACELDRHFQRLFAKKAPLEIPTAVGFCMYIKRACLQDVGDFDEETFGKGYGEENDFCMRAQARGWRHGLCPSVFVYHAGAVSFQDSRNQRVVEAMAAMQRLHPTYLHQVHFHIRRDPARVFRESVSWARIIADRKPVILLVTHHGIGGVQRHVRELVDLVKPRCHAVVMRPARKSQLQLHLASSLGEDLGTWHVEGDRSSWTRQLHSAGLARIHVHHLQGYPLSLLDALLELSIPLDFTLHDYFSLVCDPKMTGPDHRWVKQPASRDRLCLQKTPLPFRGDLPSWREKHGRVLTRAERLFVPSAFAADILKSYHPQLTPLVAYHLDFEKDHPYPEPVPSSLRVEECMRIAIIGALGPEKGADILENTAQLAERQGLAMDFHLLGYAYRALDPAVIGHGPYEETELDTLIQELNPHVIWFPALWPETYSYTLSAALKSGRPILASHIGAFPERLAGRSWTWLADFESTPRAWLDALLHIRGSLIERQAPPTIPGQRNSPCFLYERDYLEPLQIEEHITTRPDLVSV